MDLFVLLAIVVAVFGVALAVWARHGNTTAGITNRPGADEDHPDLDDRRQAFEQTTSDRGSR